MHGQTADKFFDQRHRSGGHTQFIYSQAYQKWNHGKVFGDLSADRHGDILFQGFFHSEADQPQYCRVSGLIEMSHPLIAPVSGNGVLDQIVAADTTHQHHLVAELQDRNRELEEMNARIRSYGSKVDEYVISRERLETRVNLHGFLGQALLMTRHYLQYESGDPKKIIDIWQRNIDVLRLEAEPQHETDTLSSLKNAAKAIGMQVHVQGKLPCSIQLQKLIAATGAETLTNAVRHASARQLWIAIEETKTEYVIRYTNDGSAPNGPVAEGGGLSATRRKIEAAGGRMQIESSPRFMLTIFFEKEATMDV